MFHLLDAAGALPKGARLLWISDRPLEIEKVFRSSRSQWLKEKCFFFADSTSFEDAAPPCKEVASLLSHRQA